jgi:hypothetical protein
MLIAEENLKIEHILAHALKAEMPRLNHARVNGPNRHLMGGGAFQRHNLIGISVTAERINFHQGVIKR